MRLYLQTDVQCCEYYLVFQVSIMNRMNKKTFYRSPGYKISQLVRGHRYNKHSMQDLTSLITRAPSELKKRNSNGDCEGSKIHRSIDKKLKQNFHISAGNSLLVSKNNSPLRSIKFSKRNSHIFSEEKNKLKSYKFYYQIGFGGFGRVWKVNNKETMQDWAMKEISKQRVIQKSNIESVLNELRILKQLNHPFLINMKCAFQNEQSLYLVMDYLRGGDLRYHICYKNGFTQKQIKFILANILVGLQYIHANKIIHKDLKPENIVFEESGYLRITDFGIAKSQMNDQSINARNESSGTPVYMAPEILFKRTYSYQSDFYALGVIVYELAKGKRPYEGNNRTEVKEQLLERDVKLTLDELPLGWSVHIVDLINGLLSKNPSQRLGFRGIKEIKQHRFFEDISWKKMQKKQLKPPFIPSVICEMKQYLDQILYFNQLNEQNTPNQQNFTIIDKQINDKFMEYEYDRLQVPKTINTSKNQLKKYKRVSQIKIMC